MGSNHLFLQSVLPRAPSANGIGRYVCQLQRITIKFCKNNGSSRGVRDFIETELIEFAKVNPGIVVYVKPRRHRTPTLTAEYLNGSRKWMGCRNFSKDEMVKWINLMKTHSGTPDGRLAKHWLTYNPSIQGVWSPLITKDPAINLVEFPSKEMAEPFNLPKTATEQLLEMFKEQQEMEKELKNVEK